MKNDSTEISELSCTEDVGTPKVKRVETPQIDEISEY